MIPCPHAKIFVHDRRFAIIPFLREKGDVLDVGDRVGDVESTLRDVDAIACPYVEKFLFTFFIFGHHYAVAFREKIVFIKFWVIVIAANFSLIDELEIELDNGVIREKCENSAASVSDCIEITLGGESFGLHMMSVVSSEQSGKHG